MIKTKMMTPLFNKTLKQFPIYLILILFFSIFACADKAKEAKKNITPLKVEVKQSFKDKVAEYNAEEFKLLDNSCLYCHYIKEPQDKIVAPKMQLVVEVYKQAYPTKQAFIDAFVDYAVTPTNEKAIMKGDVETYGLMDDAGHTKEDVTELAIYLYNHKID
jgi:hypothetical protein